MAGVDGAGQYQARKEAGRHPREDIGQRNNGINVDWFGLTERIGQAIAVSVIISIEGESDGTYDLHRKSG